MTLRLHFVGGTHAAQTLEEACRRKGFQIVTSDKWADIVFVAMDTPTNAHGVRFTEPVREMLTDVLDREQKAVILTSQVPPGFCASFGSRVLYHMAETLRLEDAIQRAMYPDQIIMGHAGAPWLYHGLVLEFCHAWDCPVIWGSYEDAEFAKMAINYHLAKQVETATYLAEKAKKAGADWRIVSRILRHDRRIGKYAYTTPGDWRRSSHLLRDFVTLEAL